MVTNWLSGHAIPYGKDASGRARHPSEVPRGLKCGCTCPKCGGALEAHQGRLKAHHFAHHSKAECAGALESALHLLAKDVLMEARRLRVPEYIRRPSTKEPYGVGKMFLSYDGATPEVTMGAIRPDVVLHKGDKDVAVEVVVTHDIDLRKRQAIRQASIPFMRIDLSKVDPFAGRATLEDYIIEKAPRDWVHYPNASEVIWRMEERKAQQARNKQQKQIDEEEGRNLIFWSIYEAYQRPATRRQNPYRQELERAGLLHLVGQTVVGQGSFWVAPEIWQSALLLQMMKGKQASMLVPINVVDWFRDGTLPAMLQEIFLDRRVLRADLIQRLKEKLPEFAMPQSAVAAYFEWLARQGVMENGVGWRWLGPRMGEATTS